MGSEYNKDVGLKLFSLRKELKMTRAELGEKIGLHESTIKRYEDGEIKTLDIEKIKEFAEALNTTPAYLMGWEDLDKNKKEGFSNESVVKDQKTNDEDDFDEIITLRRAMKKMEPEERKRSVDLLKLAFKEAFKDNDDK